MNRILNDLKFLAAATLSRSAVVAAACLYFTGGATPQNVTATITYGISAVGGSRTPVVDAGANKLYLPVNNALVIVDGETNSLTTLTTAGDYESGAAINALTNKFYLSGPDLLVVDGRTQAMTHVPITNPDSLAVDPSLNVIYTVTSTSGEAAGTLHVVDGVTNLLKEFPVAFGSSDLVVNPATHKLYMPHCDGDGNGTDSHYSVFNAGAETPVTFTIPGHSCNFRAAVNVATNRIYFLNGDATYTIQVIDGDLDTVIAQVALPAIARRIVANPTTNKIYALCDGGNLVVLDGATNQSSIIPIDPNSGGQALAVNLSTNQIYLTSNLTGVSVVDGDTQEVTFFPVSGGTREVVVNPITNKAYVTQDAAHLFVIDGAFNNAKRVAAGVAPLAAATNPVTGKAYVANSGGGTVTEIDGTTGATLNISVGTTPVAVAVDSATNQIYVANKDSNNVTVIDGTTRNTSVVAVGTTPVAVGVNSATNQIYVVNKGSDTVSVIDGASNSSATITVAERPIALAVNPANNKIYVASEGVADVTVIDGTDNSVQRVSVDALSTAIAVNPATNLVYVADDSDAVRVIDGATNQKTIVEVGNGPTAISVNPVTNKIYVANALDNTVSVIDGATNLVTSVPSGLGPTAIAVNPTSNKIYVVDGENKATVIDGDTNTTSKVSVGTAPLAMAVDPTSNRIYVANSSSADVTVISERQNKAIPLTTTIAPTSFTGRTSAVSNPGFSFALSSAFLPGAPTPLGAFFQVDTWRGPWTEATASAGAFSGEVPSLGIGDHILYAYAGDGQDSTMVARQQVTVGAIAAYPFTVTGVSSAQPQIILSAANATVTVTRGGSATYSLSVSAQGTLPTAVTFSCGPLPANTACSFNPASVNATSVPTTVILTVTTVAPAVVFYEPVSRPPFGLLFLGLSLLGLAALCSQLKRKQSWRLVYGPALLVTAAVGVLFFAGCSASSSIGGSGNPPPAGGTPAGSFTIVVTSSAGAVQSTTNLTLVVQ